MKQINDKVLHELQLNFEIHCRTQS